ncbi:MAG TPA: type II toxin-antitoxin system prevent-host-death family antitoxin [Thermoanaerobaculia bacterium]
MEVFDVHEAEAGLESLLDRVSRGEEILIARGGRTVAKLVGIQVAELRRPGRLRGRIRIADDFDEPLPDEILAGFRG